MIEAISTLYIRCYKCGSHLEISVGNNHAKHIKVCTCRKCNTKQTHVKCQKCKNIHDCETVYDFCPSCGHDLSKTLIKCSHCNEKNPPEHNYCTFCGKPLSYEEEHWVVDY